MLCILNIGTVPMLCISYAGTVPMLRILNVHLYTSKFSHNKLSNHVVLRPNDKNNFPMKKIVVISDKHLGGGYQNPPPPIEDRVNNPKIVLQLIFW